MSNPADFIRACSEGQVWLFCQEYGAEKNFNAVEHLETLENPACWGGGPPVARDAGLQVPRLRHHAELGPAPKGVRR